MPGCVPRCIIIDGANIMHCGSIYKDNRENAQSHSIPDVAALLSLIRFFVVQDFDVFTVISRKYVSPDVTNFKAGIDELIKNDLCVITPTSNLDDVVALEFAAQVNGIVLTSDLYRDHSNSSERYARIVSQNRLNTVWSSPLPKESRNTQTRQGGHYIANKKFKFVHDNGMELNTEGPRP
uniref:RNase NYN domain-containing protein n=1 Tax=Caenorhabditis japonica TaxID=281687 RepID=A0A8R1I504_CAEJA